MKFVALLAFLFVGSALATNPDNRAALTSADDSINEARRALAETNAEAQRSIDQIAEQNQRMAGQTPQTDQSPMNYHDAAATKTQQCSCDQAASCSASNTVDSLNTCRTSCISHLDYFVNEQDGPKLTAAQLESMPSTERVLQACMVKSSDAVTRHAACYQQHVPDYCTNTKDGLGRVAYFDPPAIRHYDTPTTSHADYKIKGGLAVNKAQTFFTNFRSFQQCVNRCAQNDARACFAAHGCDVAVPNDIQLIAKVEQCSTGDSAAAAKEACTCMQTTLGIRKWIGVCPLLTKPLLAPKV